MTHTRQTLDGFRAVLRPENLSHASLPLFDGAELTCGRIHEVQGRSPEGFALSVIACASGEAAWIGRRADIHSLCPVALSRYFNPSALTFVECMTRKEILWAAEQALRSGGFRTVVIQLRDGPDLQESRRLQLTAERGRAIGIAMLERRAQSSAAQTRWRCDPLARNDARTYAPLWRWTLTKNRDGQLGGWTVRWKEDGHATGYVDMVSRAAA